MSKPLRIAGYIVIGVLAGLLFAAGAIFVLSRTDWGMRKVRNFAFEWLDKRIEGTLTLGEIRGPGLLKGMRIVDFGIVDAKGREFLKTDSVEVAYSLRTLIGGEIILDDVILYNPRITIEKLPGDTAWNFEYVFPDTTPGESTSKRNLIMLTDARVVNGTATVRLPFEPDEPVEPDDTTRLILEAVPGGIARVMRFEQINTRLDRVIWESPLEKGRLFEVRSLEGRGFVWRDPFIIQSARGALTMRDTIVALDLPEITMPGSDIAVFGRIMMEEGGNKFDVQVDSRRIRFADLQWLYPALPSEGGGSLRLRIQSQPDGILWLAQEARLTTPGTNIAGSFGVVTGDTMYFTRVDLRASPLDVKLIEQLLPGGLPVSGLLIGTVEIKGPLSALETTGDMRLEGGDFGRGSQVSWNGVLDVRSRDVGATSLSADVTDLELSLVSALNPKLDIDGTVTGHIEGSGRLSNLMFSAALEHSSSDGGRSTFDGGGTLEGTGRNRRIELAVTATPVSFKTLASYVPALAGIDGELRGPVRLSGTADDMSFGADLASPGGPLHLEGRSLGSGTTRRVNGFAQATSFQLHALRSTLPVAEVSGRIDFDVGGTTVETAQGTLAVSLDSANIAGLPRMQLSALGGIGNGLLSVDSAWMRSGFGTARARGTVALIDGRDGVLEATFTSASLASLEARFFEPDSTRAEPLVDGTANVIAFLMGDASARDLEVHARGEGLVFGATRAQSARADLTGTVYRDALDSFRLIASADSLSVFSHVVPVASMDARATGDSIDLSATAGYANRPTFAGAASIVRRDSITRVNVGQLQLGATAPWSLARPAGIRIENGIAALDEVRIAREGGGAVVASGRLAWAGAAQSDAARAASLPASSAPVEFNVKFEEIPFTELLTAVRSREEGSGTLGGRLRIYGTPLDPFIEADFAASNIVYGDVRIDNAFAEASYAGLGLDTHAEAQHGGRTILTGGGRIPVDMRLASVGERRLDEPLRITITADSLPPALPLGLLEGFSNASGRVDGTITLAGTTLEPAMSGGFRVRNAAADWSVSGVRYSGVNAFFTLEQDRVLRIDSAYARTEEQRSGLARSFAGLGTGTVRARGSLDFTTLGDPLFDLDIVAVRAWAARRRDLEGIVSGDARLSGRYTKPVVTGALRVNQGTLFLDEMYRRYLLVDLEVNDLSRLSLVDTSLVAVRPLLLAATNPFLRNLEVSNLQIGVGSDSWLRSRDMDVEVTGDVNISFRSAAQELVLTGLLDVQRGTYTLYYPPIVSRRFQVRDGTIEFPGTPGIDPNLSITAAYRLSYGGDPLDVLAVVSGSLRNPRVRLSSDVQADLSESDLASLLFVGVPAWRVGNQPLNGSDAVVGAIAPTVFGYASSGLQSLVQSAGLLDYISLSAAETGDAALPGAFPGAQLELGRYISNRYISDLYIGYSQPLGTATLTPAVRAEWRFRPEYSIEMFWEDRLSRTPGFGLRSETGTAQRLYGFFLYRDWKF